MLARHRSREAGAQAAACLLRTARGLAPIERREHLFLLVRRDAGPVIVDDDDDAVRLVNDLHPCAIAILDCIVDEVGDRAPDEGRAAGNVDTALIAIIDLLAAVAGILADIADENTEVHQRSRLLPRIVAR